MFTKFLSTDKFNTKDSARAWTNLKMASSKKISASLPSNLTTSTPTLDEITRFTCGQDGAKSETPVDLSIIAEASRTAAIAVLQPGDHVEVFKGEQFGVQGTVQSVEKDIVKITPVGVDFDGQKVQIPARSGCKRFKPGERVKVMMGTNADETGLVVSVSNNIVTFLSDISLQEVRDIQSKGTRDVYLRYRYPYSPRICVKLQRLAPERTSSETMSFMTSYSFSKLSPLPIYLLFPHVMVIPQTVCVIYKTK